MKKCFILIVLILPLLLLAACSQGSAALQNISDTELKDNQTLVTGQVTSRVGNDIELAIGTLASAQGPGGAGSMPSDGGAMPAGNGEARPSFDAGSMPSGETGAMPSGGPENGDDFSGQPPGGGGTSGQAGDGGFSSGNQEGTATDGTTADGTTGGTTGVQIQLSGETMSLTIPVGTRVLVTSNGTLTASSFGRIQADDILQLILQTRSDGTQVPILIQIME